MAAGQGFKTFTTGEVLTAGDVNGYLMQGINVFATTTARDAAITAPAEGQFAFTKDNNSLWYYDGAAWVASGATGDIEGVTAGVGISGGGTSGTVTITNSMATAIDAKGDLVAGTGADTFSRLAVGANDTVLTADSSTATGLKWATPASGGMTLLSTTAITAASSISITGISSAYTNLQIVVTNFAISSPNEIIRLTFNGVTTTTYSWNYLQGATAQASGVGSRASIQLANQWQSAANTGNAMININVPLYANTSTWKTIQYSLGGISSGDNTTYVGAGTTNNTAAISSFALSVSAGNFTAQGNILVYGVK